MQLDPTLGTDLTRRRFLVHAGHGSLALAILGLTGCGPSSFAGSPTAPSDSASGGGGAAARMRWQRANLGFVSAYVLARGGEAAIVDTGVADSEGAIGEALAAAGLDWARSVTSS